jgi:septum formation protein
MTEIHALHPFPIDVIAPEFDEAGARHRPLRDEVLEFAFGKAQSVGQRYPESIVIGSDTMILLNKMKIGKPAGVEQARKILRALSGRTHRIHTGVAIIDGFGGRGLQTVAEIEVKMRGYSDTDIDRYLARGESLDKAGAYSIQGEGRGLIESIHGDYLAAVGLPLRPIADYLKNRGMHMPVDIDEIYGRRSFLNWQSFTL